MAQPHASHGVGTLKNGLKLIQRNDVKLNPAAKAKPGGFAMVHQGIFNGEVVAVKIPKDACSLTEKQFKEFVRELTVMASVKHPHCVTLLAACEDRTDPLLVMEWVSGGNLFEALGRDDSHALPWHVRLRIAREIASAIEFLHKCKISHGDLKSMNVLLTSDFISKICDFGAAIQRLSTTAIMSSKTDGAATLQYTLHYSAPELLKGAAANTQTDMYAFGIIMYELHTCQAPFAGVNAALLRDLIVKEGLRPDVPDPHASQFPPAFADVMQLCWNQDPALRPTAQAAHQFLISIDPSARPSAPLVLYPVGHPAPRGTVLDCIRAAMPASSAVNDMLCQMMSRADDMFKSDGEVQSVCAKYSISLAEAHSIMIYTMDGQQFGLSTEDSPYFHFNSTLRKRDAAEVERWADFSCLFCSALDKLPSKEITVFRGLNVPLSQVSHEYKANKVVWLVSVTSTTCDEKVTLQSFGTGANSRPGTLMKIRALFAKDIRAFSMFKKEAEWLLAPNTCLSIEKVLTSHDLADMKGLGVPENVDLILARQQQVSAEDILAAQESDKSDLAVFKTQQFLIRPSASKSSSIPAPVPAKSPVSPPPSASARAAAIAWCVATARRSAIAQELQAMQRIVSRVGDARYVSDDAALSCTICKKSFGVFLRRHHCLVCGIVACDGCSNDRKRGCMKCEQWYGICKCQTPRLEPLRMCLTCNSNGGVAAATSLLLSSQQSESACILAAEHTLASHGLGSDTRSLLTAGCSLSDVQGAGADTSLSSLKAAGCDARILKDAGFAAKTLLDDGFRADSLVAAGYEVSQLLVLKVSVSALRSCGLPATQLLSAGCTYEELKIAGFSASELMNEGISAQTLFSHGYAAEDLKMCGCEASQLCNIGYSLAALKHAGFTASELKVAGFDIRSLKAAGFDAAALKGAGADLSALHEVTFALEELKNAAFSASELKGIGYDAAALKGVGFDAAALKAAGCHLRALHDAGFTLDKLVAAQFSATELKGLGFDAKALKLGGLGLLALKDASFAIDDLKSAGFDAIAFRACAYDASILRTCGFSCDSLKNAGFSAAELSSAGFDISVLRAAGFDAHALHAVGHTLQALADVGYDAVSLKVCGFDARALKDAGFDATSLKGAAFNAASLAEAGYGVADLKAAGFDPGSLRAAGFDLSVLKSNGFTAAQFKAAHIQAHELALVGFTCESLHRGGYSAEELKRAGFDLTAMKTAGCNAASLSACGYDASALKEVGFSAVDLKTVFSLSILKHALFDASALKAASYTCSDLKGVGFSSSALKSAGFDVSSLKSAGFGAADLKSAQFSCNDLKQAGFDCGSLKAAGFDLRALSSAGFAADSLKLCGYDASSLRAVGFGASFLKRAKFTAASLKAAGFDLSSLSSAGYSASELKQADFSLSDLKRDGFDLPSLKRAGWDLRSLRIAGFSARDFVEAGHNDFDELTAAGFDEAALVAARLVAFDSSVVLRDGPYLYMTLHRHKVDDSTKIYDGDEPVHVPAGWQIADGRTDDVRVCGAHPWQSHWLVFANGNAYGTAACSLSSYIGKKYDSGCLFQDAKGVGTKFNRDDVLLRKRA